MEIGLLRPQEWPWVLARSVATGWEQLTPAGQSQTTPAAVGAQVQRMLQQALSIPGSVVLVARVQGSPVGYIVITVAPDELTGAPAGLFLDVWVEPHGRGRRICSQLTAAAEAHCRSLGLTVARRVIAAHNMASLRHAEGDGCQVERVVLVKTL